MVEEEWRREEWRREEWSGGESSGGVRRDGERGMGVVVGQGRKEDERGRKGGRVTEWRKGRRSVRG